LLRKKKKCPKCNKKKPIKGFFKDKSKKDGYESICKVCRKEYRQSYAQTEKGKGVKKRYCQSSKGKEAYIRYNKSDKGIQRDKHHGQTLKGKQSAKKGHATYYTRKSQAGGTYTTTEWYNLCRFYDFHCLRCNKKLPFDKLTLDHVKPVAQGGSSFIFNTQPLCKSCNSSKGNKEIDYRKSLPDWINRDSSVWQQDTLF
jgi:5-methylcytosine-specific restriction endonuclease McrA